MSITWIRTCHCRIRTSGKYRSLLQKSPIKETVLCSRDLWMSRMWIRRCHCRIKTFGWVREMSGFISWTREFVKCLDSYHEFVKCHDLWHVLIHMMNSWVREMSWFIWAHEGDFIYWRLQTFGRVREMSEFIWWTHEMSWLTKCLDSYELMRVTSFIQDSRHLGEFVKCHKFVKCLDSYELIRVTSFIEDSRHLGELMKCLDSSGVALVSKID